MSLDSEPVDLARTGRVRRLWADPTWRAVAIIAVLALAVRVVWAVWAARTPVGIYDPLRYLGYGNAIADGKGYIEPFTTPHNYPTAYYPMGYPWFVGIVTWVSRPFSHDQVMAVVLVQSVLGAASVVFGAIVARRLAGRGAAIAAALGLAFYPNLIFHSGVILGETLYNTLFLAFAALFVTTRWPDGLSKRRVALTGVVLGLAVMVRPISLAMVPVVVVVWWLATHDRRVLLRSTLVLLLAVAACILPWTIRNEIRMHQFVLISDNMGENLCIGHAVEATGGFAFPASCQTKMSLLDGPDGEVTADKEKVRSALEYMRTDPGREPWLLWQKVWFTWVRDGDHDGLTAAQSYGSNRWIAPATDHRLVRVADTAYWLVVVAGVAGLVQLAWRRRPEDLFLVGVTLMTALIPLAFFGDSRFKVPAIPLLILAAATLVRSRGGAGDDPAEASVGEPVEAPVAAV
ncbi:glycosyltransferase family 39 protein [Aquihabitans sp. McL0605]|uniref:glycosyltransferase family 39 protein n=1 Tax=Aquihabitans sp. McL0605 TaxID=3415671 RepID=UPI003CEF44D3